MDTVYSSGEERGRTISRRTYYCPVRPTVIFFFLSLTENISHSALQLFPNVPAFYILAASHELEYLSPSAARTLLQRGIRLNAESVEMWREYVKMEMGFVESMRRRWNVLGIIVEDKGKGKERERTSLDEEEVEQMEVDAAEPEGDESEAARREILSGAIVKSVISSAAKGKSTIFNHNQ